MLLPTDPDVQEALDSIGQQVRQNLPCCAGARWAPHTILGKEMGGIPGKSTVVKTQMKTEQF